VTVVQPEEIIMHPVRSLGRFASALLVLLPATAGAVDPVQGAFSHVFPALQQQTLTVPRAPSSAQSYVTFDLLTAADIRVGAVGLGAGSQGSFFDLTSARLVTLAGTNVAFGSDVIVANPFTQPIDSLISVNRLPAGSYAVEVNGTGDRRSCTPFCSDAPDFTVFLQVLTGGAATGPVVNTGPVTPLSTWGNVFPVLSGQSLTLARGAGSGPSYVSFNLLADAKVKLGALGLGAGSSGSYFDLTSIRLVAMDGDNVQFGTDTFTDNPFAQPIEALVDIAHLPAGQYALEVSGSGNRISCTPFCGDAADFTVRLQVMPLPVPEPTAVAMLLAGLAVVGMVRRRQGVA